MNEKASELLPQPIPQYVYVNQDDEINLVDIWVAFSQYRKTFFTFFIIVALSGIAFALLTYQEKYALVTTIQIGSVEKENERVAIESPESLLSKINNSIVPGFTHQWLLENNQKNLFATDVSNPKASDIVLISNKVKENDIELFSGFQTGLAKIIIEDHVSLIKSLQAGLISNLEIAQLKLEELKNPLTLNIKLKASEIKLEAENNKLKKLKDEKFFGIQKNEFQNRITASQHEQELVRKAAAVLQEQMKRIQETKEILAKNIGELNQQIEDSRTNKKAAQAGATELSAMSQLLIDNEIQQNHNRLLALEERYYVTLENEKSDLIKKLETNRLQQIDLQKQHNVLKQKYEELLLNNQIEIDQQNLVIDKTRLEIERVKLEHQNAISEQSQRIKEIETRLENYNETRMVSAPVPSLEPTGLKRNMLIVLSILLALMAGFFATLLVMFADKVKQRKKELVELNA